MAPVIRHWDWLCPVMSGYGRCSSSTLRLVGAAPSFCMIFSEVVVEPFDLVVYVRTIRARVDGVGGDLVNEAVLQIRCSSRDVRNHGCGGRP